jgi:hypothetical protein
MVEPDRPRHQRLPLELLLDRGRARLVERRGYAGDHRRLPGRHRLDVSDRLSPEAVGAVLSVCFRLKADISRPPVLAIADMGQSWKVAHSSMSTKGGATNAIAVRLTRLGLFSLLEQHVRSCPDN